MKGEIETPRLLLRQWREADLEPFVRMNADTMVMRYFPEPCTREQTTAFFARIRQEFADTGYGLYAAEEKASGLFIGFIGFHRTTLALSFCPCIEIGWRLDKSFWNKGYATEGAKACLEHGLTALGFDAVYSFTALVNRPSQRVMQKSGMTRVQYFAHPALAAKHPLCLHVLYAARKTGGESGLRTPERASAPAALLPGTRPSGSGSTAHWPA